MRYLVESLGSTSAIKLDLVAIESQLQLMATTLFDLKKKVSMKRDQALIEACIRDPRFICRKCLRAANCPRLLCKPEKAFRAVSSKKCA